MSYFYFSIEYSIGEDEFTRIAEDSLTVIAGILKRKFDKIYNNIWQKNFAINGLPIPL